MCAILFAGYFASTRNDRNIFAISPQFHFLIFGLLILVPASFKSNNAVHDSYIILCCIVFYFATWLGAMLTVRGKISLDADRNFSVKRLWILIWIVTLCALIYGAKTLYEILAGQVLILDLVSDNKSNIAIGALINSTFLSLFYVLCALIISNDTKKSHVLFLSLFAFIVAISTLQIGRFTFLKIIATPLMFYIIFNDHARRKFKRFTPFILSLMLASLLPVFYLLNLLRHGYLDEVKSIDISEFLTQSLVSARTDANPGLNLYNLMKLSEDRGFDFGLYHLRFFFNFIPRFLWEDKPIISSQFGRTIEFYGIHPIYDGTTMTFTFFDSYASFGPFALVEVALVGVVLGYLSKYLFQSKIHIKAFLVVIMMNLINYYRTNFLDSLVFIVVGFVFFKMSYVLIKFFCLKSKSKNIVYV